MKFSLPALVACPKRSRRVRRSSLVFISFLFLVSCFLFLVTSPAHAQSACDNTPDQNQKLDAQQSIDQFNKCAIEKNVFDDKIFNTNQIAGTVDSLNTLLFGESQLHKETNVATRGTGALATTGNLVASLYSSPPASGVQYFAQKIRDFNPVKPAYAQEGTIGFDALKPVQRIWTVFRNISYIGFIIVFVIMGFMIMFRAHISPQAVATVQDSIPRIVIALILVTFSYALAGLMVDVMFVFLNVVIGALAQANLIENSPQYTNLVFHESILGVIWSSWIDIFKATATAVSHFIDSIISLPGWLNGLVSGIGGGLAALVVGIAVLFIMFRIFFMLLMAYAMIIILTMAAPFFFLIQALPGRNGAGEWFKQMASQVSVFPTAALMVIFAGILGGIPKITGATAAQSIQKGDIGQFPLLIGTIDSSAIAGLIGIGILLLTPQAAELVKNAFGAKGPQLGGGIGQALAPGMAPVSSGLGAAGKYAGGHNIVSDQMKIREQRRQEKLQQDAGLGIFSTAYREAHGIKTGPEVKDKAGENPAQK